MYIYTYIYINWFHQIKVCDQGLCFVLCTFLNAMDQFQKSAMNRLQFQNHFEFQTSIPISNLFVFTYFYMTVCLI